MDAYLSREALLHLQALNLASPSSRPEGLLLGHKRGHRYFVEKVFPTQRGFFTSLKKHFDLDQLFDGKIIGFYSFQPEQKKMKKILAPFAYGKLFLEVHAASEKKVDIKSFIIDFDKKFFLSPVRLKGREK
jgi:hypothetical protein